MTIFNILELIGGLALFLYGMNVLGDSLTSVSGGKMEQLLEKLSSTKFRALLLGLGVTAVIQSSSATTVMVVALVNSGVMKLKQVVPIIMGANIGTTVTGWILSLSGISGDSFFVQMLKPSSFTPILALIGIALIFTSNTDNRKIIGNGLLGFSILMFGMDVMSGAVSPLQSDPNFHTFFQVFRNPVVGVIVGALFTALVQSSSAMTGILQALSTTGAMTFSSAIPLIMGQNIGTCITAILASIGAGRNAKRASIIHLSFNVIGTVLFMILFYTIHFFIPFPLYNNQINQVGIAIIHTVFNVVTVGFLYPFSNQLVKLSRILIPRREPKIKKDDLEKTMRLLDQRFIERPAVAVEQAYTVTNKMLETAEAALNIAIDLLYDYEREEYDQVVMLENQVDQYEDALVEYNMKISAKVLNKADNQKLNIMMHILNDVERISDHAINIADQAKLKASSRIPFSDEAMEELKLYTDIVREIVSRTKTALAELDLEVALEIRPLEDLIDEVNKLLSDAHIDRLKNGICEVENGIIIMEIYNCLERIGDHCLNVAISLIQFSEQHFRQHDFGDRHDKSDPRYQEMYDYYKNKYTLPKTV